MKLKDRVAVVTGAAQGLGEAIADRLAREGAKVVLADISSDAVAKAAEGIKSRTGTDTLPVVVDVTDEHQVRAMVDAALEEFGRMDILVSNAGILQAHDIAEFPAEVWRRVMDVNLTGYFLCAREAARVMIRQKSGCIVQINSKSGKKGSFRNSAYAASKFGGIGLTESIALDLAPHGVRVNAVCPGNLLDSPLWVDSLYEQYGKKWGMTKEEVRKKYESQVPLGRGCTYDDVGGAVVYLCSDASSYVTGQALSVTGGQ